jgi:hypothetical protein
LLSEINPLQTRKLALSLSLSLNSGLIKNQHAQTKTNPRISRSLRNERICSMHRPLTTNEDRAKMDRDGKLPIDIHRLTGKWGIRDLPCERA